MKTGAKLVIANLTGKSSVGIRYEPASGAKLTKQDIDTLMEKASRMPLKLEDRLVSCECLGTNRIGHLHTLKSCVAAWRLRTEAEHRTIH